MYMCFSAEEKRLKAVPHIYVAEPARPGSSVDRVSNCGIAGFM